MRKWLYRLGAVFALAVLVLSFTNASWIADEPRGRPVLIAHRAVAPYIDRAAVKPGSCTATMIEEPLNGFIENTYYSLLQARSLGGSMNEIDVTPTADGRIALFADATLDCRTDGKGPVRAKTMAELKALDAGYGYTADGGRTYPLRGKGRGMIAELGEILRALPPTAPLLYHFTSDDPKEADLLAAALAAAGRRVEQIGDGFYGEAAVVARIRQHYPKAWAWTLEEAETCGSAYTAWGWTGQMPDSCKGGTMIVPLNRQWLFWGWPNRLIARTEAAGTRVILAGPRRDGVVTGLSLPEQLGKVPVSFNGYVWIDDISTVGPALHPALDRRSNDEAIRAERALEARRAKQ